jgi:hypothetical protein
LFRLKLKSAKPWMGRAFGEVPDSQNGRLRNIAGPQLALTLAARRHARGHELTGHFYLLFGASLTEGLDLLGREDAPLSSITSPTVACR